VIRVEGVTLTFPRSGPRNIRERMARLVRRDGRDAREAVTALKGIELEITRGERVGVIGFNGAGKTTLLKVICGIYPPTGGQVVVDGDVACLFELATGFEMESTGWDNIMTRGLLLGMTRAEVRARMREIGDFTELGPALERPVKTYSNGMIVRLAFAISTAILPDVLLLDEVIAAGDMRFHDKAGRRLQQLVDQASILVLVSHSMEAVRSMCDRALWLHEGRIQMDGPASEVTRAYTELAQ
jgi:lipopolysaccharide transport system ATP-binding protein